MMPPTPIPSVPDGGYCRRHSLIGGYQAHASPDRCFDCRAEVEARRRSWWRRVWRWLVTPLGP